MIGHNPQHLRGEGKQMTTQQVNQITAVVALVLMVILFVLVAGGVIPALVAIILTVAIGYGVRFIRARYGQG